MRHLKIFGLALLAVCSLAVIAASAASAETFPQKTALTTTSKTKTSVIITSEAASNQVFAVENGSISCTTVKNPEKTVELPATTIEIHPEYSNCKAFGANATFTTTGCNFVYHITETLKAGEPITATTTFVCEAGKEMTITNVGNKCVITIGSQNVPGVFTMQATETTSKVDDILILENYPKEVGKGVTYTESEKCAKPGAHTNGGFVGNTTVTGFTDVKETEGVAEHIRVLPE